MSIGTANTVTLYDKDGNPVVFELVNGKLSLIAHDDTTHAQLDDIKLLLAQIVEILVDR